MSKGMSWMWAAMFRLALTLVMGGIFADKLARKFIVIQRQLHYHLTKVW